MMSSHFCIIWLDCFVVFAAMLWPFGTLVCWGFVARSSSGWCWSNDGSSRWTAWTLRMLSMTLSMFWCRASLRLCFLPALIKCWRHNRQPRILYWCSGLIACSFWAFASPLSSEVFDILRSQMLFKRMLAQSEVRSFRVLESRFDKIRPFFSLSSTIEQSVVWTWNFSCIATLRRMLSISAILTSTWKNQLLMRLSSVSSRRYSMRASMAGFACKRWRTLLWMKWMMWGNKSFRLGYVSSYLSMSENAS